MYKCKERGGGKESGLCLWRRSSSRWLYGKTVINWEQLCIIHMYVCVCTLAGSIICMNAVLRAHTMDREQKYMQMGREAAKG